MVRWYALTNCKQWSQLKDTFFNNDSSEWSYGSGWGLKTKAVCLLQGKATQCHTLTLKNYRFNLEKTISTENPWKYHSQKYDNIFLRCLKTIVDLKCCHIHCKPLASIVNFLQGLFIPTLYIQEDWTTTPKAKSFSFFSLKDLSRT